MEQAGITKTALILVGEFLGDSYQLSKLYDKTFSTEFRRGIGPDEQEKGQGGGRKMKLAYFS